MYWPKCRAAWRREAEVDADLALLKYDSAGNLAYLAQPRRGGRSTATPWPVSADGQERGGGRPGGRQARRRATSPPTPRRPTASSPSTTTRARSSGPSARSRRATIGVNALAFAADGSLYATGTTAGNLFGQAAIGSGDGYIRGYSATGKVTFSSPYGTTGGDKGAGIVVDGSSLVVAGIEGGEGGAAPL